VVAHARASARRGEDRGAKRRNGAGDQIVRAIFSQPELGAERSRRDRERAHLASEEQSDFR
jgi:hypothetical protein